MQGSDEGFKFMIVSLANAHYAQNREPLLLSMLGAILTREKAWPSDRGDKTLKQLLLDYGPPELNLVWDDRSPERLAVVTEEVRKEVEAALKSLHEPSPELLRLQTLARVVLIAFCISVPRGSAVQVRRSRPFRYRLVDLRTAPSADWITIEDQFRCPDLRADRLERAGNPNITRLLTSVERWVSANRLNLNDFAASASVQQAPEKTALDRLLDAQPAHLVKKIIIPADIAQILSKQK
jgi:hypothetical protein